MNDNTVSKDAIVIERTLNASLDLIWSMWTDPDHFKQWYGPMGMSVPVAEFDVRVDGKRTVCMESPDGNMKMWTTGVHTAVAPSQRLAYTESMADEAGNLLPMGDSGQPMTTEVIVELEDENGSTKMTMTHAGVPADSPGASGWEQAIDKLEDYIEKAN